MRRWARASSWRMPTGRARRRSAHGSTRCRWRRFPEMFMRLASVALALLIVTAAQAADDLAVQNLAVDVENVSTPTLCAETDNVYLKLISPAVRRFTIESVHPSYIGTIVVDRSA